jgi:hypothetical protein
MKNLLAAALNLDIDYDRMSQELLKAKGHKNCVPFSYPADKVDVTAYSLFLRKTNEPMAYSYRGAKSIDYNSWLWDYNLDIPYTREVIQNIPFKRLGAVRVVYFPDVPCVEHTDWDDANDNEHTLGLSIIPNTAETFCNVWSEQEGKYLPIPGNAMLLNDSIKHWVPQGKGTRITMRVFGEIDYSWFEDKIIPQYCYYR